MTKNVLAVGAHPDDVEFSCAGTLLKHIQEGDNVTILHMTNTGYKNLLTGEVLRTSKQSQKEAKDAADILGCNVIQLDFVEQKVPFNVDSVVAIEKVITELNIDTIYTHSKLDCHQDHISTCKSVLAASRNIHNIFLFEQLPLPRVRETDSPNFFVDITDFFDNKLKACRAHVSQVEGKYGEKIINSLISLSKYRGSQSGCDYAEAFETVKQIKK